MRLESVSLNYPIKMVTLKQIKPKFLRRVLQRTLWFIPKIQNLGSDDIPDISFDEIKSPLSDMKNNRLPPDDSIVIESIEESLLRIIQKHFSTCLLNGTML